VIGEPDTVEAIGFGLSSDGADLPIRTLAVVLAIVRENDQ
jgi:hypothetical protein